MMFQIQAGNFWAGNFWERTSFGDFRLWLFLFSLIVYGIWGSPTPDQITADIFLTGALLMIAAGFSNSFSIFRQSGFLALGLCVPVVIGLVHGNELYAMVRDVIPFVFLFLPCLLRHLFKKGNVEHLQTQYNLFLVTLIALGFLFAFRSIDDLIFNPGVILSFEKDFLYLANSPILLFALLYLSGWFLTRNKNLLSPKTFLFFAVFPVFFSAIALDLQRAGFFALFICLLYWLFFSFPRRPVYLMALSGFCFLGFLMFQPVFLSIFQEISFKNSVVGLNARAEEALSVFSVIGESFLSAVFGLGWGGTFFSVAAGNTDVGFTHNIFTYFLLKAGFIGLIFICIYLTKFVKDLVFIHQYNKVLSLSLAFPFLIHCFFYAGFKSLDFGLLLLMIIISKNLIAQKLYETKV